jgi:hypothetical protein
MIFFPIGIRKKCIRKKWSTDEEEKELKKYFSKYFQNTNLKTCPSRKQCEEAIAKSRDDGGCLHKRGWENIKKK